VALVPLVERVHIHEQEALAGVGEVRVELDRERLLPGSTDAAVRGERRAFATQGGSEIQARRRGSEVARCVAGVSRLARLDLVVAGVDVEGEDEPGAGSALGVAAILLGRDEVVVDPDAVEAGSRRSGELQRVGQERDVVEVGAQRVAQRVRLSSPGGVGREVGDRVLLAETVRRGLG
jgi:hypothetical protein